MTLIVDVSGDESKIQCCEEQYCIGTWTVRSMNQGKLNLIKEETEQPGGLQSVGLQRVGHD